MSKKLAAESISLTKRQNSGIVSLKEQASELVITGEEGLKEASAIMADGKKLLAEIESIFKTPTQEAHLKHKAFKDKWNEYNEDLEAAIQEAKDKVEEYDDEQRRKAEVLRKQQEAEEESRKEAQRKKEEEAVAKAAKLAKAGKDKQAEKVLAKAAESEPAPPPPPTPAAPVKVAGMSRSTKWTAKVTNLKLLCQAISEGEVDEMYVEANMSLLNKVAATKKSRGLGIAGVVGEDSTQVSSRG